MSEQAKDWYPEVLKLRGRIAELEAQITGHKLAESFLKDRIAELEERIRLALTWLPNNPGTAMGCLQEKPE